MTVRIISWDVGIIHLAYCVLEWSELNSTVKILDWDEMNLIEDDRISLNCSGMTKSNKICGSGSKYYIKTKTAELIGFCKTHLKQYTDRDDIVDAQSLFTEVTNSPGICHTCTYVKKDESMCGKKAKYTY